MPMKRPDTSMMATDCTPHHIELLYQQGEVLAGLGFARQRMKQHDGGAADGADEAYSASTQLAYLTY